MHLLRSIKVDIEIDTNKLTDSESMQPYEEESIEDFADRVRDKIIEMRERIQ